MVRKELGKITNIRFGYGGYQEAMFGLTFGFGGDGWACGDFIGTWASSPSTGAKWSVKDQSQEFDKVVRKAIELCTQAKVTDVYMLAGKPIEATFEDQTLRSWRLLTEVI